MKNIIALLIGVLGWALVSNDSNHEISGTVVDFTTRSPIMGVKVEIKEGGTHVKTNAQGEFMLDVAIENPILVFSHKNYFEREVLWKGGRSVEVQMKRNSQTMDIIMEQEGMALDEVMVVGYSGKMKRASGALGAQKAMTPAFYSDQHTSGYHDTEDYDFIQENAFQVCKPASHLNFFS